MSLREQPGSITGHQKGLGARANGGTQTAWAPASSGCSAPAPRAPGPRLSARRWLCAPGGAHSSPPATPGRGNRGPEREVDGTEVILGSRPFPNRSPRPPPPPPQGSRPRRTLPRSILPRPSGSPPPHRAPRPGTATAASFPAFSGSAARTRRTSSAAGLLAPPSPARHWSARHAPYRGLAPLTGPPLALPGSRVDVGFPGKTRRGLLPLAGFCVALEPAVANRQQERRDLGDGASSRCRERRADAGLGTRGAGAGARNLAIPPASPLASLSLGVT